MPLEASVTLPEDLNPLWPLDTDQAKFGAAHLRNIKLVLKELDNSLSSGDMFKFFVPSGGIIMWSGATNNIPSGWVLCDGRNNTPDLRNRFVVGAGSGYAVGNTGGASSVTSGKGGKHTPIVTVHSTTLNSNHIPQHRHDLEMRTVRDVVTNTGPQAQRVAFSYERRSSRQVTSVTDWFSLSENPGGENPLGGIGFNSTQVRTTLAGGVSSPSGHTHGTTVSEVPDHTHTVSVLPPYYALAFIMKT